MKAFTQIASSIVAATVLMTVSGVIQAQAVDNRAGAEIVTTSDLDLTSVADAETLYRRIRSAAASACRGDAAAWDGKRALHRKQCFESAVDQTVSRVNAPLLTEIHGGQRSRVAGL